MTACAGAAMSAACTEAAILVAAACEESSGGAAACGRGGGGAGEAALSIPTEPCSGKRRCLNSLPPECLEASLVAFSERLYGSEPEDMLCGLLSLMRGRFVARDGNAAAFDATLARQAHGQTNVSWDAGLPGEVLAIVIKHLRNDPATLGRMAQVCRTWNREVHRRKVWQDVCCVSLGCCLSDKSCTNKLVELLGQNDYRPSLLSVAPLVLAGADLTYRHGPATPLLLAAFHGHLHAVKFLLTSGANPIERSTCGKNALQLAAMRNHQEVVAWLCRNGFSLHERDECGNSVVHVAALGGAKNVLVYLKAQGVSIAETNSDGMTALHCAAMNGSTDVLHLLLGGGFDLPVEQRAFNGHTAIHRAALYGRSEVISVLMRHGGSLAARDNRGANVVMLAALGCVCKYSLGDLGVQPHNTLIEFLLTRRPNEFSPNDRDSYGRTALHYARAGRNFPTAETLIRLGADEEARDEFGASPADHEHIVRALQNRQEQRLTELLNRVTGLALTFGSSSRSNTHFDNSHLRVLCRCLRHNLTVRKVVLINTDVNVTRNIEALLELFSENRTLCELDFGESPQYRLPLGLREYLAVNCAIRDNGGQCPNLAEHVVAVPAVLGMPLHEHGVAHGAVVAQPNEAGPEPTDHAANETLAPAMDSTSDN